MSDDNYHRRPTDPLANNIFPIMKHMEWNTQNSLSSAAILMNHIPSSPSLPDCSSKKKHSIDNIDEYSYVLTRKRRSAIKISMTNLKIRLRTRESFYVRLAFVSNFMCFLGISGIILMIIENEITFKYIDDQDTKASWFIKLIITLTTIILLVSIFYYHYLTIKLHCFRNAVENWYIEITCKKILIIIIEILICAIHPIPRSYPKKDPEIRNLNLTISDSSLIIPYPMSYTAIDVGLGLPMFFRLYLFGRSIMFHSHMVRNVSLRSLGYFNRVSIDFYFLMKTHLEQRPGRFLFIICTTLFLIGSWALRACDYTDTNEHMSMSDAMWLFIVTFTSVGYGDRLPSTYSGRTVAAIIGLLGLFLSGLLIAILTVKLLLTREEKYVHTFLSNMRLANNHKKQAANIIKFAIKVWYLKRKNKSKSIQFFHIQQKLFRSILSFQKIKQMQRNLIGTCVGFNEIMTIENKTNTKIEETSERILVMNNQIQKIEKNINYMNNRMDTLQNTLDILLDTIKNQHTQYKF